MSNECPGTSSKSAGHADACEGCPNKTYCQEERKIDPDIEIIKQNMSNIKLIVAVISGKGGVGKSTMSRNLSESMSKYNYKTLLIDFDVAGPSVPRLTNTENTIIYETNGVLYPIMITDYFYCISVGHFIKNTTQAMNSIYKTALIKKILKETCYDDFDVVFIDTPPGVSDEHLSLINFVKTDMTIIVTTPQKISMNDVIRQIDFCKKAKITILGLIENMKGLICQECGHNNILYKDCGVKEFCANNNIGYLGEIGMEQEISKKSDLGIFYDNPLFDKICLDLIKLVKK